MSKELSTAVTLQKIILLVALATVVGISAFNLSSDSDLAKVSKEKTKMEELAQDAGN